MEWHCQSNFHNVALIKANNVRSRQSFKHLHRMIFIRYALSKALEEIYFDNCYKLEDEMKHARIGSRNLSF